MNIRITSDQPDDEPLDTTFDRWAEAHYAELGTDFIAEARAEIYAGREVRMGGGAAPLITIRRIADHIALFGEEFVDFTIHVDTHPADKARGHPAAQLIALKIEDPHPDVVGKEPSPVPSNEVKAEIEAEKKAEITQEVADEMAAEAV